MTSEKTLALLQRCLEQGYCLHGSSRRIEKLEPRQARCDSGRKSSCQKAIYASKHGPEIPCLAAMFTKIDKSIGAKHSWSGREDGPIVVTGKNVTFGPGFVYVLSAETFVEFDNEFISYESVRPIAIISVSPDILRLMPRLDIRVPFSKRR